MKMYKTQKIALVAGVVALLCLSVYVFVYRNTLAQEHLLLEKKATYLELFKMKQKRDAVESFIVKTKKERTELANFFVQKENPIAFIADLENAATQAGAQLTIDAIVESDEDGVHYMTLTATILGTYEHVYKALAGIEMLHYVIFVNDFSVEQDANKGDEWKGTLHIKVPTR